MKAKLIVEGKEFDIEIQDPELQKLVSPKKTGYERVKTGGYYYIVATTNTTSCEDCHDEIDDELYQLANYYSDLTVAKNNARADKLMRQLRRFAVERREFTDSSRTSLKNERWLIKYDLVDNKFEVVQSLSGVVTLGMPWFNSERCAQAAIDRFRDELIWYFTEYKDSL